MQEERQRRRQIVNAENVLKMLRKGGQPMTLTRKTTGTFDPVSGSTTGDTSQAYTVYGITKNYTRFNMGNSFNDTNSMVLSGDKEALIDAVTVVPMLSDVLTIMGVDWVVVSINETSPQGVPLMYSCQIRK